jgi:hypothetical protein
MKETNNQGWRMEDPVQIYQGGSQNTNAGAEKKEKKN